MNAQKFLIFVTSAGTGGAQTFCKALSTYIQSQNNAAILISGQKDCTDFGIDSCPNNSTIIIPTLNNSLNPSDNIRAFKAIFNLIKSNLDAKIICNSTKASILVRIACLILRRQCTFVVHGWGFERHKITKYLSIIWYLEMILYIIGGNKFSYVYVSYYDKLNQPGAFAFKCKKFIVSHNGATDLRKIALKNTHSAASTSLKLVTVARLSPQKDVHSLINAVQIVTNSELTIIGDGPDRKYLEDVVIKKNLTNRIIFVGLKNQQDIANLLQRSDLFLLLSKWEGFPIAPLEALSLGLPIIITAVGGAPEILWYEDQVGKYGELISSFNSPQEVADAIRLYFDDTLLTNQKINARKAYDLYFKDIYCYSRVYNFIQSI